MKMKGVFATFLLLLISQQSFAIEKMYGVAATSYSDLEFSNVTDESAGYKLVLGHQFHKQWYVEAGYYQLADVKAVGSSSALKANALYLGVLGKASHPVGELFYRLGAANLDLQQGQLTDAESCTSGSQIDSQGGVLLCGSDETIAAGILGIGFDYYVATKTFVRFEAEYIVGQDSFKSTVLTLGLRYNFN